MLSSDVIESEAVTAGAPSPSIRRRLIGRWRHDVVFFLIAGAIIALDQFTKWLVRSNLRLGETWPEDSDAFVRIIHVTNSGAAFGILQGQTLFLIVTSLIGLMAILLYYIYPPMEHGLIRIALSMQLGGAIGNLIDRVRMGEVTDFVDVGGFPTFNVADSSISVSIAVVMLFFLVQEVEQQRAKQPPGTESAPARDD